MNKSSKHEKEIYFFFKKFTLYCGDIKLVHQPTIIQKTKINKPIKQIIKKTRGIYY